MDLNSIRIVWFFDRKKLKCLNLHLWICVEHAPLFEAFEFVFGSNTTAKHAEVVVVLRQDMQIIHFSHSKSADSIHAYGIKIEGIDEDFRVSNFVRIQMASCSFSRKNVFFRNIQVLDKQQYIEELENLNIFASTMAFMFGSRLKYVLPTNDHDLRWYLEKNLMNEPELLNDYDDNKATIQVNSDQKNAIVSTTKIVNSMKKDIEIIEHQISYAVRNH